MRKIFIFLITQFSLLTYALETNQSAPNFVLTAHDGKSYSLQDYKDKTVVLEWLNHECPYVKKHYGTQNMQKLQKKYTKKGVKWFSIISSAPGKQGHVTPKQASKDKISKGGQADAILLDPTGKTGRLYGAKTTPHMYIIHKGKLVYQGAIDDHRDTDPQGLESARNFVSMALNQIEKKQKVKIGSTKSYGCSVKY